MMKNEPLRWPSDFPSKHDYEPDASLTRRVRPAHVTTVRCSRLLVASRRWSTVYAGAGSINTSDAREKQQVRSLSDKEKAVASKIKGMIKAFKFNDSVEQKGADARIHFGVMAQEVKSAFESEGLAAEEYALLCYDEWPEQKEEKDNDGNIVQQYQAAGNRYGIRYDELLVFMLSAM